MHENMPTRPASPYAASKLAAEAYCAAYAGTWELETVALRFSNVYGPGSQHKGSIVAKFIKSVLEKHPFEIYGDGEQTRDFLFLDDLCEAVIAAMTTHGLKSDVFHICTGVETSVKQIIDLLSSELKVAGFPLSAISYNESVPGKLLRNHADPSKAYGSFELARPNITRQ